MFLFHLILFYYAYLSKWGLIMAFSSHSTILVFTNLSEFMDEETAIRKAVGTVDIFFFSFFVLLRPC